MADLQMSSEFSSDQAVMAAGNILVLPLHVTEEPNIFPPSSMPPRPTQLDALSLNDTDESLADLQPQPEEETEWRGGWEGMTQDQRKLEYMASLGLVPPAVLEEVHRRQQMCKTEYGNWWDRLHSTDFCLVPKTESGLHSLHMFNNCEVDSSEDGVMGGEYEVAGDVTQVAPRPDAGALVEQITYLTSWPQTTPPDTANSVEIITQPTPRHIIPEEVNAASSDNLMSQTLREHYSSVLGADRDQMSEDQLQAALQHITSYR